MKPFRSNRGPAFSFLVHPRSLADVDQAAISGFLRAYSRDEVDLRQKLLSLPPIVLSEIRFGFQPIWGELVSISRLPEHMMVPQATTAVAEALEVAASRGAKVVGLGALTSPACGGGLQLLSRLPTGTTLTTGNALTAAVLRQNVVEASELLGLGRSARVAVVGATGSVGVAASHLLAESGFPLLLVGRNRKRVERLLAPLKEQAQFADGYEGLVDCDVIVLLVSGPDARIEPEAYRPGCAILDCAQPASISDPDLRALRERGVRVVEGGLVSIPEFSCGFDFRLEDQIGTFACLAETYLFAREGIRENSVGRASPELARRLERIAERRGVRVRPLYLRRERSSSDRRTLAEDLQPERDAGCHVAAIRAGGLEN